MTRFMRKVRKTEGCWFWEGVTAGSNARYGYFRPGTRPNDPKVPAHRWLYTQLVGPIGEGMEIDHLCRTKLCVRPDHLEPVTHAENRKRGRLTTCRRGLHDLTDPTNVRWDNAGNRRGCKACHNDRTRERRQGR